MNDKKVIQIGEELLKVFEKLKAKVKQSTWGIVNPSYYELGEILARKIEEVNLI